MAKLDSVIGFDFSSYEIRAVEMSKSGGSYNLLAMGKMPIEHGVVEEGFIRDAEKFSDALLALMKNGNFTAENYVLGVNNENVVMRYASFPKVSDDKLRNMIFLQAQEFMPIPVQEMEMDFFVAGESVNTDEQDMVDVVLVGARKNMLEQIIDVMSAAKKSVIEIEPTALALCRAASMANSEACYCLLNLSDGMINFMFVKNDKMFTVRSIQIPEKHYESVQKLYTKEFSQEEFEEVIDMLVSELNASISYYSVQYPMNPVDVVYFVSDLPDGAFLAQKLQENVSVPVTAPSFYANMNMGGAANMEAFTACISMAIQALEG